ncbi:unnamed protein product [Schistosoma margrebowiei]|uniref:Uncharacterized protein n=1 Tax=Schistosoma margrebowiei TaxID=48269 RepID=A0A183MEY6_9TREM|nr:unnamed protein product [Schistosoma margrebowiei]
MKSRTRVSSYLGLVSWMYLHLRVDVHSGARTQYHSLQKPSNCCSENMIVKSNFNMGIWTHINRSMILNVFLKRTVFKHFTIHRCS